MAWTNVSTTTKDALNIRSGQGTNYGSLGVIPGGATVVVTGPAVNGWLPVTYNGISGWSKQSFMNAVPAQPSVPATPQIATPFYDPNSAYGNKLGNQSNAPIVTDKQEWEPELERWSTMSGFGGIGTVAQSVMGRLEPKLQSGFAAAKLNNPGLQERDYFKGLGTSFIRDAAARMTPGQRGESYATKNPLIRQNPR